MINGAALHRLKSIPGTEGEENRRLPAAQGRRRLRKKGKEKGERKKIHAGLRVQGHFKEKTEETKKRWTI